MGNGAAGIYISSTSSGNSIGFDPPVSYGVVTNVISGNAGNGIVIDGSSNNTLSDNNIGVDFSGAVGISNGGSGILITGSAANNVIGGTVPGGYRAANVISGNGGNGITLGDLTNGTTITNNIIGYGAQGVQPLPNIGEPISTNLSTGDTISNNQIFACFARASQPDGARSRSRTWRWAISCKHWTAYCGPSAGSAGARSIAVAITGRRQSYLCVCVPTASGAAGPAATCSSRPTTHCSLKAC